MVKLPHQNPFWAFHPALSPRLTYLAQLIEQNFNIKVSFETSRRKNFYRSSILRKNELVITFGSTRSFLDAVHELCHFLFTKPEQRTKKNYGMSFEFDSDHNYEHLVQEVMASLVGSRLSSNVESHFGEMWILGSLHKYSGRECTYVCSMPPHIESHEYLDVGEGKWALTYNPANMIRFNKDNLPKVAERLKNYYEGACKADPKFPYDHKREPIDADFEIMAQVNVDAVTRLNELGVFHENYWVTDPKTWKVWGNK